MRDSFVFYRSYAEAAGKMTTEQKAAFLDVLCAYALDDVEPEVDGLIAIVFDLVKPQIDSNNHRYESGKKGGRPKKETQKPVVIEEENHRLQSEKANVNVNDNVNDNDNTNIVQEPADESLFLYLWGKYPNKKGKAQVSKKAKRALLAIGADEMERAIDRYVSELAKDSWRKPQNGSTFFNSGYVDYLDANYEPSKQKTGNAFLDLLQEGGNDTG